MTLFLKPAFHGWWTELIEDVVMNQQIKNPCGLFQVLGALSRSEHGIRIRVLSFMI